MRYQNLKFTPPRMMLSFSDTLVAVPEQFTGLQGWLPRSTNRYSTFAVQFGIAPTINIRLHTKFFPPA
jgi:hypothetical protein